MLRVAKILLVMTVALWGLLGAVHNLLDWAGTIGAVGAATSMATIENGPQSWQATSNPVVIWLGALGIVLSKMAVGILGAIGAWRMWLAKSGESGQFSKSKELALIACAIAVIMLFGGFIVIAEGWFELWRSEAMRGPVLDTAFRYAGMITLIALFVGTNSDGVSR